MEEGREIDDGTDMGSGGIDKNGLDLDQEKSCRLRLFNQLDPRINKRAFTEEEEERLLAAHEMYGNKWAKIARQHK
ncbi:Transcription factor CSA [Camellia lanceoleosa]|uniref:Transcription factor CSA n=1 Tax=Camellia lanceoleosa TaxID=1840588 RepID=A0ACC0FQJ7_9ERIC|nr:Transcription factor CSA [Camellia lanceoleosa]